MSDETAQSQPTASTPEATAAQTSGTPAGAAPAAAAPAAAPKASKGPKDPKVKDAALPKYKFSLVDVFEALRSRDKPTRRTARRFVITLIALFGVVAWGVRNVILKSNIENQQLKDIKVAENLDDFLERTSQSHDPRSKQGLVGLGDFTIELVVPEDKRPAFGIVNMAQIEVWLECDSRETCEKLEKSQEKTRHEVANALVRMTRDEFLSREGKYRLKKSIIDRLNQWLPKGRIENVYFTKLVIG